jgi:hypothetical protein
MLAVGGSQPLPAMRWMALGPWGMDAGKPEADPVVNGGPGPDARDRQIVAFLLAR